jgi:hypothetical protein
VVTFAWSVLSNTFQPPTLNLQFYFACFQPYGLGMKSSAATHHHHASSEKGFALWLLEALHGGLAAVVGCYDAGVAFGAEE